MKEKIKEIVYNSIIVAWAGVVVGGGIAIGFMAMLTILLH